MAGALGCYHRNVNVLGRLDAPEMDIEAVSEHEHVSGLKVRLDVFLVHVGLKLVIYQDHDDISLFGSLGSGIYFKSLLLGPLPAL